MKDIKQLFSKPGIISIIGDVNTGKSNLIHALIKELNQNGTFHLCTYGFRAKPIVSSVNIHSVEELELIKNSIIIIDEVMSLFDLDNRMSKKSIENTLRLIHHNNNVLILSLLPENMKKFLSGKINIHIFKKCTIADFINGSRTKNLINAYHGVEKGSRILNLPAEQAIIYDENHYKTVNIPYMKDKDLKQLNQEIIKETVNHSVNDTVNDNAQILSIKK